MQAKRWQAIGMVAALAVAIPACSKDKEDEKATTTTTAKATTTTTAEETTTTAAAEDTTTTTAGSGENPTPGAPVNVTLTCPSPADIAGIVGDQMEFTLTATPNVPATAAAGGSAEVSLGYKMAMPEKLVGIANQMGIATVGIANFNLEATVSGGGTGGPLVAEPKSYNVQMNPLVVPEMTATGTVTVNDAAQPTTIELSKVGFSVIIEAVGMDFPLTCTFPAGSKLAVING